MYQLLHPVLQCVLYSSVFVISLQCAPGRIKIALDMEIASGLAILRVNDGGQDLKGGGASFVFLAAELVATKKSLISP